MKNCLVAQSGGPTSVINASVVGVYERNKELNFFNKIYFGINGIEGIINNKIIDASTICEEKIHTFKNSPSSGLGSCRYKMPSIEDDETMYEKVISILKSYDIDTFFYIGGNDSMDTVSKFSQYSLIKKHNIKFIGIPKTIDNDLFETNNCPGFGSAAKYIATSILETYIDASVYSDNGVFIIETMGRDTGWLASSACLATINNKQIVDLIYLPEAPFEVDNFLDDVKRIYSKKKKVYIAASEGIKDKNGDFIAQSNSSLHDKFGHKQLGGVANKLKELILDSNITNRVKTLELGTTQRCAHHLVSEVDIKQAFEVGKYAVDLAKADKTGIMVTIKCNNSLENYDYSYDCINITKIANKIKYFPSEWISPNGNNIHKDAFAYLKPLVGNLPNYTTILEEITYV